MKNNLFVLLLMDSKCEDNVDLGRIRIISFSGGVKCKTLFSYSSGSGGGRNNSGILREGGI